MAIGIFYLVILKKKKKKKKQMPVLIVSIFFLLLGDFLIIYFLHFGRLHVSRDCVFELIESLLSMTQMIGIYL